MVYRGAACFYMVRHPKPTLHGIRRGGASFHFGWHNSYDRTAEHGRWAHSRTAKLYIDEAGAELALLNQTTLSAQRIADAQAAFRPSLNRLFPC